MSHILTWSWYWDGTRFHLNSCNRRATMSKWAHVWDSQWRARTQGHVHLMNHGPWVWESIEAMSHSTTTHFQHKNFIQHFFFFLLLWLRICCGCGISLFSNSRQSVLHYWKPHLLMFWFWFSVLRLMDFVHRRNNFGVEQS